MSRDQAELIRQFVAEHTYRMIFAASPAMDVPAMRPRIVNGNLIREEEEQWRRWHEEQTVSERNLMGTIGT